MNKLLVLLMLLFSMALFSQENGSVQGTVIDLELQDEPLFFATVSLKGSSLQTTTNFHGNFELTDITPGSYTLLISYLGYETLEIPVVVRSNQIVAIQEGLRAKSISLPESQTASLIASE